MVTKLKISLCGIGNPRMIVASSEVAKGAHAVPDVVELVLLCHLVNGQEYKDKKTLKLWKVTKNKNYAYLLEAIHKPMTELRLTIETNRTFNADLQPILCST